MSRNIAFSSIHVFKDIARTYLETKDMLRVFTTCCTGDMYFEGAVTYAEDALVLDDGDSRLIVIAWDTIEIMSGSTEPMTKGINESTRITERQAKSAPGTSREWASLTPDQVAEAMRKNPATILPQDPPEEILLRTEKHCQMTYSHSSHEWGFLWWCPGNN